MPETEAASLPTLEAHNRHKYILNPAAQSQQRSGWAAVEGTLIEYDRQEIGSYKEDMDTLLVFTGLYSAVLAAFVVVSYTELQEDTAVATLHVLQVIANQTAAYVVLGGQMVNSTADSSTPPPFQPTIAAIRVNVLWFASLVISLSTASFAILVKQWLRSYVAFASSSPKGQLRVREFRREGLQDWHVFEIASTLPLLLQLSLALFFIGLCFFSLDIHPAIGHTTLPLVSAWAFLLIAVTLSPVFSARCPYKTPALSSLTASLRTRVWCPVAAVAMPWVWRALAVSFRSIHYFLTFATAGVIMFTGMLVETLSLGRISITDAAQKFFDGMDHHLDDLYHLQWRTPQEETEVLNDPANDLAILASADAFQANADVDLTMIRDALEQSKPEWHETVKFLVQIIGNRVPLPAPFSEGPKGALLEPASLSSTAFTSITALFDTYVLAELPQIAENATPLKNSTAIAGAWATYILFSMYPSDTRIPSRILFLAFDQWLSREASTGLSIADSDFPLLPAICHRIVRDSDNVSLLGKVKLTSKVPRPQTQQSSRRRSMMDSSMGSLIGRAAYRLSKDLDAHLRSLESPNSEALDGHKTLAVLFSLCGAAYSHGHQINCGELLSFSMQKLLSFKKQENMQEIIVSWISQPSAFVQKGTRSLAQCFSADHETHYTFLATTIRKIARLAIHIDCGTAQLLNLSLVVLWIMNSETQRACESSTHPTRSVESTRAISGPSTQLSDSDPYHLSTPSLLSATTASSSRFLLPPLSRQPNKTLWRQVFLFLASALRSTRTSGDYASIASACWHEVDLALPPEEYPQGSDEKDSPIPDYFCLMLSTFHTHTGGWQARRIRQASEDQQRVIKAAGEGEIGRRAFV